MTRAELSVNSRNLLATTAPDEDENEPREECGVFGVWAPGEDVAKLTYYGLYALQHRGQEAAGIAVADGSQVLVFKDLGLLNAIWEGNVMQRIGTGDDVGAACLWLCSGAGEFVSGQTIHLNGGSYSGR
ncbi:SDR family oxidoreductase [Rhodococcus hoagii]|nr:SDR family oxidoreductase [Prescottella equi]